MDKVWRFASLSRHSETGYPVLVGGFELAHRQSLLFNTERVVQKYQMLLHGPAGRFDGRLLMAGANGPQRRHGGCAPTPRKVSATPKPSTFKSPAARNLRAQFARASSFENQMMATPLTARDMQARRQPMLHCDDASAGQRLTTILASHVRFVLLFVIYMFCRLIFHK